MKTLRVYGWMGFWRGDQVRNIVAAHSWAEASRISGDPLGHMKKYGSITGNAEEIKLATAKPGAVFCIPSSDAFKPNWQERTPETNPFGTK